MHDAIVAPDFRSFEFHPKWGPGSAQMGAFKDGEGNFFFAWFSSKGAVIRGFDHESKMSPFQHDPPVIWPGIFDGLPTALRYVLKEPAFAQDEVTFAFWADGPEGDWRMGGVKPAKGHDSDGAQQLLGCFGKSFENWRKDYYDTPKSPALKVLWDGEPLTPEVVLALNPEADFKAIREEAALLSWKFSGLEGQAPKKPTETKTKAKTTPTLKDVLAAAPVAPKARSFGAAQFVVALEPTRVRMLIHGKTVVAEAKADIYSELFDLVKARILEAKRKGVVRR